MNTRSRLTMLGTVVALGTTLAACGGGSPSDSVAGVYIPEPDFTNIDFGFALNSDGSCTGATREGQPVTAQSEDPGFDCRWQRSGNSIAINMEITGQDLEFTITIAEDGSYYLEESRFVDGGTLIKQ